MFKTGQGKADLTDVSKEAQAIDRKVEIRQKKEMRIRERKKKS